MKNILKNLLVLLFFTFAVFSFTCCETVIPTWVMTPEEVYPESDYLSQMGYSTDKDSAKVEALTAISQYLKTSVASNLQASLKAVSNDSGVSKERTMLNEVNVSSSVELFGVQYTEPFYDKKNKTWYSLAYIDREDAWEHYRPVIEQEKEKFYSFFDKAEEAENFILEYKYLSSAEQQSYVFLNCLETGRLVNPKRAEEYKKVRSDIARLASLKQDALDNCTVAIVVENDSNNQIFSTLSALCGELGLSVQKKGRPAFYKMQVLVDLNVNKGPSSDDIITSYPSLELSLIDDLGETLYSYNIALGKIAAYSDRGIERSSFKALIKDLEANLVKDYNVQMDIK